MRLIKYYSLCLWLLPYVLRAQFIAGDQAYYVYGNSGREYEVTTPTNYTPSKKYPIVFELHGMGFNRGRIHDNDDRAQRQQIVDELQYISIRPQAEIGRVGVSWFSKSTDTRMWNSWSVTDKFPMILPNDVNYIRDVYNVVRGKVGTSFDPNKVYVYGFSNGGAMAIKMVQETDLFKAACIHSMSLLDDQNVPSGMNKIPIMFIHGTKDTYVPYNGGSPKNESIPKIVRKLIKFRSIKETVDMWSNTYGLSYKFEAEYEKKNEFIRPFFYREYTNLQYPIYFFVSKDTHHVSNAGFEISNVRRAFIHFFNDPVHFGIYRTP